MAKTSLGKRGVVEFYGFDELIKKLDKSESQIKKAIEKSMKRSSVYPKKDMLDFIKKHHLTGLTESSFKDLEIYWDKTICKGDIGFSIDRGGIAALMLDIGTPKIKPKFFIYYAVSNNRKLMREEQEKALNEILGGLR